MGESPSVSCEAWRLGGGKLGEGDHGMWFMATFQGKGVIVCVITQGITLDTVRPLGVCVCVGRETSQARRHYGENAVSISLLRPTGTTQGRFPSIDVLVPPV